MTLSMCVTFFAVLTLVSAFLVTLASSQYSQIIISSSRAVGINSREFTTCSPLNSISRAATCTRFGERVSCISPLLPYTKAKVTCRINYGLARSLVTGLEQEVECSPNGRWEPEPITCSPVCGVVNYTDRQKSLPINGIQTQVGAFPWHANLWMEITTSQGPSLEFRCSGTIIQTDLVLTAAHCVADKKLGRTEDPRSLRITAGKSGNSRWVVQKIKNVYRYCNPASDIALVELEDPFQFSSLVLPVCLDVSSSSEQDFRPGTKGKIGRSSASTSVPIVRTDEVTYASNAECKMSNNPSGDKFCGFYSNERNVCDWNDGSGFVVEKKGLWHLMGVFIKDLAMGVETSQRTCGKSPYALYTNVASYMAWIQDVIFKLVRYKSYPTCTIDTNGNHPTTAISK